MGQKVKMKLLIASMNGAKPIPALKVIRQLRRRRAKGTIRR